MILPPQISDKSVHGTKDSGNGGDTSASKGGRRRLPNDCKGKEKRNTTDGTAERALMRTLMVVTRRPRRSTTAAVAGESQSGQAENLEGKLEIVALMVQAAILTWR